MRILKRAINNRGAGSVKLEAEEDDDMYHLFNLISKGDIIEGMTVRNVITELKSGARDKTRVQTKMTIQVDKVEFDAEQCALRVNGTNMKENPHIKLGQFHTMEIELNRPFDLEKENWDSVHNELLDDASDATRKAEIAALVMQEGRAELCLIKSSLTRTVGRFSYEPGKKKPNYGKGNQLDKATVKFFDEMYNSMKRHVNFETIKVILVGSPGTLCEDFIKYLSDRCIKEEDTPLIKNRSKCLRAVTTCGTRKAIEEMLGNPDLVRQLSNVKAADEIKALNTFINMFNSDPARTAYGLEAVMSAVSQQAVAELLITDKVYRTDDFKERNKFVELMEDVKNAGGQVYKFSSLHVSGEKLDCYTGIAATLRFSVEVAELADLMDVHEKAVEAMTIGNSRKEEEIKQKPTPQPSAQSKPQKKPVQQPKQSKPAEKQKQKKPSVVDDDWDEDYDGRDEDYHMF